MTALAVINGVAIVVLVVVTAYYAWQSREMAREMRQARLLSLLPKLALDVEMVGPTYGTIVVRNVGTGPAFDADLMIVFEAGDEGTTEQRQWQAHVIAPGERHEFLPPTDVDDLTGLITRHPVVALRGAITDALDQPYEIDERIDLAEWWRRQGEAVHRWQDQPANRLIRELEKIKGELNGIRLQVSTLATEARRRDPSDSPGPSSEGGEA